MLQRAYRKGNPPTLLVEIGTDTMENNMLLLLSCFNCVQLFCHLMDHSPPGSSVHGILQARILEWVAISFSRRTIWRFLKKKKLKIVLPYDPAILFLGIYPEKTIIQKDTWTPMFIAALFTIAKTWKQSNCLLTEEWIKTTCYIYLMGHTSRTTGPRQEGVEL